MQVISVTFVEHMVALGVALAFSFCNHAILPLASFRIAAIVPPPVCREGPAKRTWMYDFVCVCVLLGIRGITRMALKQQSCEGSVMNQFSGHVVNFTNHFTMDSASS